MKVLVTGGTGVIGAGAIPELLSAGHAVRLLSRGARRDAREYPQHVEPFQADVSDPTSLRGAAAGCDAVVHITGIVEERPPEITFQGVNVQGTANMLDEAQQSGVRRFVFLSSLGADWGKSDYHASKLQAENLVQQFPGEWVILRPGNVYGPGDDVISSLLKMVRSLPAVPVIDGGDQRFQPIWFTDLGQAIARAVADSAVRGGILEVTGDETTTTAAVVERLKEITGRTAARVSVGSGVASAAAALAGTRPVQAMAEWAGLPVPLNRAKLQMLLEENLIRPPSTNALASVFGIQPTPLDEGLRILADQLPELLPSDGVGSMERKRFSAWVPGATADALMSTFRHHLLRVMPLEFSAEPGADTRVEEGATLTAAIPGRGNIQVRVEEAQPHRITFATLEGHPLAGIVTFQSEDRDGGAVFGVELHARASNLVDWLATRTIGAPMQNQNWRSVVRRVAELQGVSAPDVEMTSETVDEADAERVEKWVADLVQKRKRREVRDKIGV